MYHQLSEKDFLQLAENNQYVAVYREFLADTITPMTAFACLASEKEEAILLESGSRFQASGAYSFIGINPYANVRTKNGVTVMRTSESTESFGDDPFALLRTFHQRYRCADAQVHGYVEAGLLGPMMGFLGYEAVRYVETLPDRHADDPDCPDIYFNFYRTNLIFNHEAHTLLVSVVVPTTGNLSDQYVLACQQIDELMKQLQGAVTTIAQASEKIEVMNDFETDCDDAAFMEKVQQAKTYLQAGDVFQVVLSRTFYKSITVSPFAIYRILRHTNPTPYMFYMKTADFVLLGASPEKMVSLTDREVVIAPIAGTVPVVTSDHTEALLDALKNDPKQCAEHMMLVDLGRNDIGALCEPGSVSVTELMTGQRLAHVMHMVSYVKGHLSQSYDAFDVLRHVFPAGTLSGAPKIRAMTLIDQLEESRRHLYGGAVCKVESNGNLDSCIIIRSGLVKNDMIYVRAGAGIVFDSDPAAEAAETRHKAKAVLMAVAQAS